MPSISIQDIEALMEYFQRGGWREMHLRIGDTELFLSKDGTARLPDAADQPSPPGQSVPAPSIQLSSRPGGDAGLSVEKVEEVASHWVHVKAPSLGTFYRAPKPGSPPFAEIGQRVTEDVELCLIEVMKLFTTMRAGVAGTVRKICVNDGDLVEFDQVLFLIEPDA